MTETNSYVDTTVNIDRCVSCIIRDKNKDAMGRPCRFRVP